MTIKCEVCVKQDTPNLQIAGGIIYFSVENVEYVEYYQIELQLHFTYHLQITN